MSISILHAVRFSENRDTTLLVLPRLVNNCGLLTWAWGRELLPLLVGKDIFFFHWLFFGSCSSRVQWVFQSGILGEVSMEGCILKSLSEQFTQAVENFNSFQLLCKVGLYQRFDFSSCENVTSTPPS